MPKTEDLDLDVEKDVGEAPKKAFPVKLVAIIAAAVLTLGGGSVGVMYALGLLGGGESTEAVAADDAAAESDEAEGDAGGKGEKNAKVPATPAQFMALEPAFIVNFNDADASRFLQITVEVSARDALVLDAVKANMPIIRNNLVLLFSSQKIESLASREGKEKLRTEALAEIQKVLKEQTGKPGVENVFFTSFVMQ